MTRLLITVLILASAVAYCTKEEPPPVAVPPAEQVNRPPATPNVAAATPNVAASDRFTVSDLEAVRQAAAALTVYFCFDCANLDADAAGNLEALAGALQALPTARLAITGGADERGTAEYNLQLGLRRATAAETWLRQAGVRNDINVSSVGEGRPACRKHRENCWKRNRRAQFEVR